MVGDPALGFIPQAGEREAPDESCKENEKGEERQDEIVGRLRSQAGHVVSVDLSPYTLAKLLDRNAVSGQLLEGNRVYVASDLSPGQ